MNSIQGNIERITDNMTAMGKPFKSLVIDGERYSVFDEKLFGQCIDGANVTFSFIEKGEYKNIVAIVTSSHPASQMVKVSNYATPAPVRNQEMSACNALNNTIPFLELCVKIGINLETEPHRVQQMLQLTQGVSEELAKTVRGK